MIKFVLPYLLIFALGCQSSKLQQSEGYWTDKTINTTGVQVPESYRGLGLNLSLLIKSLEDEDQVIIPLPTGKEVKVNVKKSSTMSSELASKFPEIKSFEIVSDTGYSGRIDINPSGFYAMLVTLEGTYFINPTAKKSDDYISFDKKVAVKDINNPFIDQVYKP